MPGFDAARRSQQVAGRRPGGGDGQPVGVVAENALDRPDIGNVAERRRGAVGIDVVDPFRRDHGVVERRLHHPRRAVAFEFRRRHVVGVCAHAATQDFGIGMGAAGQSRLALLQDQHPGALAKNEAVAADIPGPGRPVRLVVAHREIAADRFLERLSNVQASSLPPAALRSRPAPLRPAAALAGDPVQNGAHA